MLYVHFLILLFPWLNHQTQIIQVTRPLYTIQPLHDEFPHRAALGKVIRLALILLHIPADFCRQTALEKVDDAHLGR